MDKRIIVHPHGDIFIGVQGENKVTGICFPVVKEFKQKYGEGSFNGIYKRSGDENAYPVLIDTDEENAIWVVTNADTALSGLGQFVLTYVVDENVKKSQIYRTVVAPSMEPSANVPEGYRAWVDAVIMAGASAGVSADEAKRALDALIYGIEHGEFKGDKGDSYVITEADYAEIEGNVGRDLVKIQDAQPTESGNRIWVKESDEETEIPTMAEFNQVSESIAEISETTKNLFDKSKVRNGYRLVTDGRIVEDSNYWASDYIPVEDGKTYTKNSPSQDAYHRFCTYDSAKAFRRAVSTNTITIESGEAFVRFCGSNGELDTAQFELGNKSTTFVPPKSALDYQARADAADNANKISDIGIVTQGIIKSNTVTNGRPTIKFDVTEWGQVGIHIKSTTVNGSAPNVDFNLRISSTDSPWSGFIKDIQSNITQCHIQYDFDVHSNRKTLIMFPNEDITGFFEIDVLIVDNAIGYVCENIDFDKKSFQYMNANPRIGEVLRQMKRPEVLGDHYDSSVDKDCLLLLHFTDIHGHGYSIQRASEIIKSYQFDDVVCTGDMVPETTDTGYDFWGKAGLGKVLTCIGNHDDFSKVQNASGTREQVGNIYLLTQKECYDMFINPYKQGWGTVHPSGIDVTTNPNYGACYYYKDYTVQKIRLIMLDCMHWTNQQGLWLSNVLSNAKSNGYGVMIGQHYPPSEGTPVSTKWCFPDLYSTPRDPVPQTSEAVARVSGFIDNGGEFICWLSGHYHKDMITKSKIDPRQLDINLDCAVVGENQNEADTMQGTKASDCFTAIAVDRRSKIVKAYRIGRTLNRWMQRKEFFCYRYSTGELIAD